MFDNNFLTSIAEGVVTKEEERSHLDETGMELVHFDFEILKVEPATFHSGRSGDFYKFAFEYKITSLDESRLLDKEDNVRHFRRALRIDTDGNVVAIGERVEIFD